MYTHLQCAPPPASSACRTLLTVYVKPVTQQYIKQYTTEHTCGCSEHSAKQMLPDYDRRWQAAGVVTHRCFRCSQHQLKLQLHNFRARNSVSAAQLFNSAVQCDSPSYASRLLTVSVRSSGPAPPADTPSTRTRHTPRSCSRQTSDTDEHYHINRQTHM
jgi:hypothetical protein